VVRVRSGGFPRIRRLLFVFALGLCAAVLPVIATSAAEPTIEAAEGTYPYGFRWSPSTAEVSEGGAVAFQNTSATVAHGIVWKSVPATPTCEGGVPVYATFTGEGKPNWKGKCTFLQAGTYSFYCSVHGESMSGAITVAANGTTTITTTGTTGTTGTMTTTTTPPPSPESFLAGPESQALKIAKSQHGGSIKGLIDLSKAAVGGRLEIDLFAQRASLAKAKHRAAVRVGRLVRSSLSAGKLTFSVKLNARARRAIKRRHRLALTVKVVLTPASGKALTISRSVVQHA
jgi:plastocyanin